MSTTDLSQSKRLKELGAPQNATYLLINEKGRIVPNARFFNVIPEEQAYASYDLGELIEWIGDDFVALHGPYLDRIHGYDPGPDRAWEAIGHPNLSGEGATPLDAVVALAEVVRGAK